jgi:uncharacterized membrane protein
VNFYDKNKKQIIVGAAAVAIATAFATAGLPIPSDAFKPFLMPMYCWIWTC